MRRFWAAVLAVAVGAGASAFYMLGRAPESSDPEILSEISLDYLCKDIYLDGVHYNNWQLADPIAVSGGIIYVPVSTEHMSIQLDPQDKVVTDLKGFTAVSGRKTDARGKALSHIDGIIVSETGTYYYTLSALRQDMGYTSYYSDLGGLYLSSNVEISAEEYHNRNSANERYIEGRVLFMMECNKNLSYDSAVYYEYLFRHEAWGTKYVTGDLLLSITRTESNYREGVGTRAIGLMQALLLYAKKKGYSKDDLLDPHTNINYGKTCINGHLNYFKGNKTEALSAYNLGRYAVIGHPGHSRTYSNKVQYVESRLHKWIEEKGYSNTFNEVI